MAFKLFGMFDSSDSATNKSKQKGQKILIFGASILVIAVLTFFIDSSGKKGEDQQVGQFTLYNDDAAAKTKWITEASQDMKQLKEAMKQQQIDMQKLRDENQKLKDDIKKAPAAAPVPQQPAAKGNLLGQLMQEAANEKNLYQAFPTTDDVKFNPDMFLQENSDAAKAKKEKQAKKDSANDARPNAPKKDVDTVTETAVMSGSLDVEIFKPKNSSKKAEKKLKSLLPSGSILHGVLLNGMNAPTMSQAKDNPLVTSIIIKDEAILPNHNNFDLRECFVLGEGFGDLSAERVYIRMTNMSCVNDEGDIIDLELKGYASGEDGKIGLKGDVISKQGAILARAIVAGFVDGVAQAFNNVGQTISVTPYSSVTSSGEMDNSKVAKKGMYQGVGNAAKKLADFYLKLADQTFPVIEIAGGREVDIVVTELREIKPVEKWVEPTVTAKAAQEKQIEDATH